MANVHALNQDNVLGDADEDDLSPSVFGDKEDSDEPFASAAPPKKSGLVPIIGFSVIVLLIVGVFGWKIFSPYFKQRQSADNSLEIATISPQRATSAVGSINGQSDSPGQLQPAADPASAISPAQQPQAAGAATTSLSEAEAMPPIATPSPAQPAASQQGGQAAAPMAGAIVPVSAQSSQASVQKPAAASPVAQPASSMAPVAVQRPAAVPAAAPVAQSNAVTQDDLSRVNARIDNLEKMIASIKESVIKLSNNTQAIQSAQPVQVAQAERPAAPVEHVVIPKHAVVPRASKHVAAARKAEPVSKSSVAAEAKKEPTITPVSSSAESTNAASRPSLKAVLEGRAWFQTKGGESMTATTGDDVPGWGIVKSIDMDRGEVRFANGQSAR